MPMQALQASAHRAITLLDRSSEGEDPMTTGGFLRARQSRPLVQAADRWCSSTRHARP
jgi:hypothetical protein